MADLARRQRLNTPEELYAAIGYGGIQLSRLMIKIKDEYTKLLKEQSPAEVLQVPIKKQKSSEGVIVEGWTTAWSNLQSAATRCRGTISSASSRAALAFPSTSARVPTRGPAFWATTIIKLLVFR